MPCRGVSFACATPEGDSSGQARHGPPNNSFQHRPLLDGKPGRVGISFNFNGGYLTMGLLVLVILILFLIGGLPGWGYHSYGYAPSGFVGVAVIVLVVLLLAGRL
jgi:Protein of unknown function (DUF3309)